MQGILTILTILIWDLTFIYVARKKLRLNTVIIIVSLLLYLIPVFYLPTISDVGLFETVGMKILERVDFYAFDGINHGTYPFLPFMLWYYAFARLLTASVGIKFIIFVRMLMILVVIGITVLIGKLLPNPDQSKRIQSLFLLNPVNMLVVSLHGQTDLFLIFFALMSIWILYKKKESEFFSGITLGLSILVKTWSIIFVPLFIFNLKNISAIIRWLSGLVFILFLFTTFYIRLLHSNVTLILEALMHAGGPADQWGITGIGYLFSYISPHPSMVFNTFLNKYSLLIIFTGLIIGYVTVLIKKNTLLTSIVGLLLTFMFITPRWGIQYTPWILPFAAAAGFEKSIRNYSFLALPYLSLSYILVITEKKPILLTQISIILSLFVWLYCINWLVQILNFNNSNKENRQ